MAPTAPPISTDESRALRPGPTVSLSLVRPPSAADLEADRVQADSALFSHFLVQRSRARGPLACVNARFLFLNTAASSLLGPEHRDLVWAWAVDALDGRHGPERPLRVGGATLTGRCRAILDESSVVGAELRLHSAHHPSSPARPRWRNGWEGLNDSEIAVARLVAEGLTNREIGARLYLSRHTVDFHLRQIYRTLGIGTRVELTRLVLANGCEAA